MTSMNAYSLLKSIKEKKPLIHHITNWVTIYDCANMTRALGALPVMAHAPEEVADMTEISNALVLNIGTLTIPLVESMLCAAQRANQKHIPVVFDAVGVGATPFRDEMAEKILSHCHIDVIKGNASEISRLAGISVKTKGVESTAVQGNLQEITKDLAKKHHATVVITAAQDIVSSETETYTVNNGHALMGCFVGTGCMVTSVIAAFCTQHQNYAAAASAALACYGIAGELAAQQASAPAAFKQAFFDAIYTLNKNEVTTKQNIICVRG